MAGLEDFARRIERIEARQAIGELPCRYAIAIDARDIDGWLDGQDVLTFDFGAWSKSSY